MIEVKDLKKSFVPDKPVLDGINCKIEDGEQIVVIGPSGGGKSTFLRCLNMLEVPSSGQIIIDGEDITAPASTSIRCARIWAWCFSTSTSSRTSRF